MLNGPGTPVHESAFEELKHLLTQDKELAIQCDASGQGLGTTLLQEGKSLAYASRALSDTETRYATIKKEILAIVCPREMAPALVVT